MGPFPPPTLQTPTLLKIPTRFRNCKDSLYWKVLSALREFRHPFPKISIGWESPMKYGLKFLRTSTQTCSKAYWTKIKLRNWCSGKDIGWLLEPMGSSWWPAGNEGWENTHKYPIEILPFPVAASDNWMQSSQMHHVIAPQGRVIVHNDSYHIAYQRAVSWSLKITSKHLIW